MAELIDRQAFIEDIKTEIMNLYLDGMKGTPRPRDELYDLIARINEQPGVDGVEVVRCKDCARCEPIQSGISGIWSYDCTFHDMEVNADDYCSYGERREDDG